MPLIRLHHCCNHEGKKFWTLRLTGVEARRKVRVESPPLQSALMPRGSPWLGDRSQLRTGPQEMEYKVNRSEKGSHRSLAID